MLRKTNDKKPLKYGGVTSGLDCASQDRLWNKPSRALSHRETNKGQTVQELIGSNGQPDQRKSKKLELSSCTSQMKKKEKCWTRRASWLFNHQKPLNLQLRDSVGLAPIFPRYLRWLFPIRTESHQYITPNYSCWNSLVNHKSLPRLFLPVNN